MLQSLQILRTGFAGRRTEACAMLAMGVIYFLSFFQRVAVPGTIFNELQSDLALSAAQVTGLGAAYLYIYGSMQIFVGYAADRFGGLRAMLAGSAIMALGAILFPLSNHLLMVYVSRAMIGFGGSFVFICMLKELDILFGPRQFAHLYGPFMLFGGTGALCATLPLERLVHVIGWRPAFGIVAILTTMMVLWLTWLARRINKHEPHKIYSLFSAVARVVGDRRVWIVILPNTIMFLTYFLFQATIGKKFLQDTAGLSSSAAATVTLSMLLVSLFLTVSSGSILAFARHRRKPVVILTNTLTLIGIAGLALAMHLGLPTWIIIACMLLTAVAAGISPASLCLLKELCPSDAVGVAMGICNTIVYLAVACGTNLTGVILDHHRAAAIAQSNGTIIYPPAAWESLFTVFTFLAAAAFVLTLFSPETLGRHVDDTEGITGRSVA